MRLAAGALRLEGGPLPHPEPVLLVDDGQRKAWKLDRLADHGVGADHDLRFAGRDRVVDLALRRFAVSDPDRNSARTPRRSSKRREAGVVLPREDLGRGHERPLPSGPHRAGQRDGGHRGLAAADVTLEQPAHRPLGARSARMASTAAAWSPVSLNGSAPTISSRGPHR